MSAPRITALRELAQEAELERRDFLYEATEQLRRFIDSNRERLREIGPVKLVDDDQDYLLFHPVDETWTTRLTYQDPADSEWYDEEQVIDSVLGDRRALQPGRYLRRGSWRPRATRSTTSSRPTSWPARKRWPTPPPRRVEDWQAGLPPTQQETIAAQRLWQLADAFRGQIGDQQKQALREFAANAEEVLARTGDLHAAG